MKKVLLISTNAIGDTYVACSAIEAIKQNYAGAFIDIAAAESSQFFLKKLNLSNLFLIKKKSFKEVLRVLRNLRKTEYDLVFNFFPGQVNSIFFQYSRGKQKAGFRNFSKKMTWHNSNDKVITIPVVQSGKMWNHTDNYLKRVALPLEAAGINVFNLKKPVFDIDGSGDKKFDIVMHLFSSDSERSIPYEKIAEILQILSEKFFKCICLIGNETEVAGIKKINDTNSNILFFQNPEIDSLVYAMKNSSLFIGVDSFPLHIADAYSIKTAGIFTSTNENSVFQKMNNKYVLRISDMNKFSASDLINFLTTNKLI